MKRILFACFNFLIVCVFSQEKTHTSNIEVSNFYGNIAEHSISISHLITSHPYGSIVSWNKQTYGYEDWEQYYGYPEYGGTFIFQDMRNGFLGKILVYMDIIILLFEKKRNASYWSRCGL